MTGSITRVVWADRDLDETHDPARTSWLAGAEEPGTAFPIQNLPIGIFRHGSSSPRAGVAIGDYIIDLAALPAAFMPDEIQRSHIETATLDSLLALGRHPLRELRRRLSAGFAQASIENELYRRRLDLLVPSSECELLLPTSIPDYTDFYAGIEHARRAGSIARPGSTLSPNYGTQPIGYHGRASTVRVSGAEIRRPHGPFPDVDTGEVACAPTRALDFELELGLFVCGTASGRMSIGDAAQRIAGVCLLNDWSARDIQRWEMTPLGPFLGKSFATTISPWIVTWDALAPFRIAASPRDPQHGDPPSYLLDGDDQASGALDIELLVSLCASQGGGTAVPPEVIARSNTCHLYWTPAQMLAHHSVNGCTLRPGDLIGSGTISGPNQEQSGSLLELTRNGASPLTLRSAPTRTYLEDGDEIVLSALCRRPAYRSIAFGPCAGRVVPEGELA